MWKMGCSRDKSSDHQFNFNTTSESDSNNGLKKLRPLMPKPTTTFTPPPNINHPSYNCSNCLHDHLATSTVKSRWNPTPEQKQALEEMYQEGTRTPTADQIQQIAAQLCRFGKIEGKNVFYWFQNHKARERAKRRRIMVLQRKEPAGLSRSREVAQAKNWEWETTSISSTLSQESASTHRAALVGSESTTDGWSWNQLEERELQTNYSTWQPMKPSYPPPPNPIHFMSSTISSNTQNLVSMSLDPNRDINYVTNYEEGGRERSQHCHPQTLLHLFPPRSGIEEKDSDVPMTATIDSTSFTPSQFFEFLPLKKY